MVPVIKQPSFPPSSCSNGATVQSRQIYQASFGPVNLQVLETEGGVIVPFLHFTIPALVPSQYRECLEKWPDLKTTIKGLGYRKAYARIPVTATGLHRLCHRLGLEKLDEDDSLTYWKINV